MADLAVVRVLRRCALYGATLGELAREGEREGVIALARARVHALVVAGHRGPLREVYAAAAAQLTAAHEAARVTSGATRRASRRV